MKYGAKIILLIFLGITSCEEAKKDDTKNKKEATADKKIVNVFDSDFENFIRREIEAELAINAAENYTLEIHRSRLDKDTITDAVITLNRREFGLERMKKEGKENLLKKSGYTLRENYVFVYKGSSGKVLTTPPIGSSVFHTLSVFFEQITTPGQNDFWVEYRFRNSLFRNYYTLKGETLYLTLNCPVFDQIGEENPEVFDITHRSVKTRIAKDIVIYEAVIPDYDPENIEDINDYSPSRIEAKEDIFVYFIYDNDRKSYVTPMAPLNQENE
jgi:hypothetical protein